VCVFLSQLAINQPESTAENNYVMVSNGKKNKKIASLWWWCTYQE